ncbi:efflux RND transporter permease subunit, partial [Nostoc sp. CHAB 5834]|nr:efflux RND transporter permease subunit [Nostoc sp. CHAB 5834]
SVVIILMGAVGYNRIGVDRTPDVEFPILNVSTSLPGASPETVAQTVTQPLETQLNTISGIDTLSSSSVTGQSNITVSFSSDKNMAEALNDVQSRISQARRELPTDAQASVVRKFDMNASPLLWMTLSGNAPPLELTAIAKQIQKAIEPLSGVGEVQTRGTSDRALHVTVNDAELNALGLTYGDIQAAFTKRHINAAGGKLKVPGKEYQVELNFEMENAHDLKNLGIATKGGRLIRLGEVAEVKEGLVEDRGFARFNEQPTVSIGVVKSSGVNPVELIQRIRSKVAELQKTLPAGLTLDVVSDDAKPIEDMVNALKSHLFEGTLLTALVVWLFLKSVRATSIVATAIPVSLFGAIAVLYFAGYTFNSFTLLALLLLIGVVVDDAIVVLENIYKTQEHHPEMSPSEAAHVGATEVLFAVMAASLTLVCVFGPVIFLPGIMGQFFKSFAVTVVAGVLVSWFVALTLTPMLCARFLRVNTNETGVYALLERALKSMERRYLTGLNFSLKYRKTVLALAALTLVPAFLMLKVVKTEFSPQADEGRISVRLDVAPGLSKETLLDIASKAEKLVGANPKVQSQLTTFADGGRSGSDSINISVVMDPRRKVTQAATISSMQSTLSTSALWKAQVTAASSGGGGGGGAPVQFYLKGPSYKEVEALALDLQKQLAQEKSIGSMRTNLGVPLPQLTAEMNTQEADRLGISAQAISTAVAALNGQVTLGKYTSTDGERYDMVLRSAKGLHPEALATLGNLKIRTASGDLVPLDTVVKFSPTGAATSLQRVNQQFAVTFMGTPAQGAALGDAIAAIDRASAALPSGYTVQYSGQAAEMAKVGGNLGMVFIAALILLYLVLASQFNSFAQPFVVMLAQPLAVIGGIGALALTGQSLNIYSVIGLVLLVGLVAKNSILLVDRTNQLREQGADVHTALIHACPERLRPVVMTSLTLILAMLPAAFGLGAGAENNQPLALAIIGGMASSTLHTLLVVPAAYSPLGPRRA